MEFPLPKELTTDSPMIKLTYLGIEKDNFVIDFIGRDGKMQRVKSPITGYKDEDNETLCKLIESKLAFVCPDSVVNYVIAKLGDAVNELYTSDKHAMKFIEKIRKKADAEAEGRDAEDEVKLKKIYIQKYFDKSKNLLYEAVLVAGKPYFVYEELPTLLIDGVQEEEQNLVIRLVDKILLPDTSKPTTELLPPEKEMYLSKPFEFASEKEINKYLKLAQSEDFDSLYRMQKNIVSKYIDAPSDTHLTILAADSIFTYFQDKLGQTHYLVFVGDNDTGKTANLRVLQQIGYRAMLDVDITAANIYGFLGNFEEGQGIILEDEADDIDRKPEKMKIYKAGYNAGEKVTRTDITGYGRRTQSWNTYCFKAFTAEKAPDSNAAKGFLDRTFMFHCIRGEPAYDITEILNPAGDNDFTELLEELNNSRKLLFAFRLLHYQDLLPNIELSVKTREKQLCKPVLRLFQSAKCKEEIGKALANMIDQKRGLKRDTLEAKILDVVGRIITENQKEQEQRNVIDNTQLLIAKWQPNQIPTSHLFEQVAQELGGTYRREREDKSFETEEHGIVSHTAISRICVDKFGAEAKRTNSIRFLEFNLEKLEKAKSAYIFPDKVEILTKSQNDNTEKYNDIEGGENETLEQETHPGPNNEAKAYGLVINERENKIKNIEKCCDGSDEYSLLEDKGGSPNEAEELEIEQNTGVSERKSTQLSGNDEISLYTSNEKNTSQPSPQDTEELFQLIDANEQNNPSVKVIKKAMQYCKQRGLSGYFTKEDYVYAQMMEPNERWTVDQAEHRLYALLEDGIVEEKTSTENLGGKATVLRITKKEEPAPGDLTAISLRQLGAIFDNDLSFAKLLAANERTEREFNTSQNTFHLIEHSNLEDANSLCGVYGESTLCLLNADDEEQNYFLIADEMDDGIIDEQWNEYRKQSAQDRDFNGPKPEPPKPTKIPTMLWTRCNCVSFGNMKLCEQCMSKFTSSGDLEK